MPKPKLRILIVSHPPVEKAYGAAQIAISLGEALGERCHDVTVWSPEPLETSRLGWNKWLLQRRAIERFLGASRPFDVVDLPPVSISPALAEAAPVVVARSVQPDLLYLESERRALAASGVRNLPRYLLSLLAAAPLARALAAGWHRAHVALCLGSHEREWMADRFPGIRGRLREYVAAPGNEDRRKLHEVARSRRPLEEHSVRWLWIGRWVAHKGTRTLLEFMRERFRVTSDRFTIAGCGEGVEREMDQEWIRVSRVQVVPSFRRVDLPRLLGDHDAGLFTSEVEGWGLSVQEMLESGLPVAASHAGCVPDLAAHLDSGLVAFPPSGGQSAQAPVRFRESYRQRFDWSQIAASYEATVVTALQQRGVDI